MRAIALHKGVIEARNLPGNGLAVSVILPALAVGTLSRALETETPAVA